MTADWTTCRVVRDHDGDLWSPWTHACHDLDADCAACWAHDLLAIINPESEG